MEVIVRIIKLNPWTGITKWDNCYDYISTYLTRAGNVHTGLTKDDQRRFENELGYDEDTLSPDSSFWDTFAIKIGKKDLILDTDKAEDEMKYLFLKNHKRVADGLNNITPSTDYVLVNKDAEAEQANKVNKVKREAYRELDKLSIENMRQFLRISGIKSDTMSNELIEAKCTELVEKNPQKFIDLWVNNNDKDTQYIIEEAISKGVLRKNRTTYYYGTDIIGNSVDETIAYFKDKKNQDIKLAVMSQIKVK